MYKQVEKSKENKSRMVANSVTQKKRNGKQSFGFVDNRPEGVVLRGVNGSVPMQRKDLSIQFASEYDGILPAHDTYQDSYKFGPTEEGRSKKFTYHHIIPENKLKLVATELKGIKSYFSDLDETEDNKKLRGKGTELDNKVNGLVSGAKSVWLNTRITNVTFQINSRYSIYSIAVTESEVGDILRNNNETLDVLFPLFRDLIKAKAQRAYDKAKGAIKGCVKNALKEDRFYGFVNTSNKDGIEEVLTSRLDGNFFNFNTVMTNIMDALKELRKSQKYGFLNKREVMDSFTSAITPYDWDYYYAPALHQDATTSDDHLKKIIQQNGLPHAEQNHLKHAVQWNPGNIHRGPSSTYRLNPDSDDFDDLSDDGGEKFEKAAVNLLKTGHFKKLETLSGDIDTFLLTKVANTAPDNTKVELACKIVDQMKEIQALGATQFREEQWEKKGVDKMRLKKVQEKISAAYD
ncbi:MAG: hypothetical protein MI799_00505 [Desulfobacterales bacterium]|nr:hypothetical protein [Desulfobacterales bacterium]